MIKQLINDWQQVKYKGLAIMINLISIYYLYNKLVK